MAKEKIEDDRHVSFEDTGVAIGQNTDGSFNIFPASELPEKLAELRSHEEATTYAIDASEAGDPEDLSDLDDLDVLAHDSAWNESDHPRAANGEFGSSGRSSHPRVVKALAEVEKLPRFSRSGKPSESGADIGNPIRSEAHLDRDLAGKVKVEDFAKADTEEFDVDSLVSTQDTVGREKVIDILRGGPSSDDDLRVVVYRGKNVLWDGNHRVAAIKLAGGDRVRAKTIRLDDGEKK